MEIKRPSFFNKRQRIVIASVLLTLGFIFALIDSNIFFRARSVIGLGILAYFLSLWALWQGMTRFKAIVLLVLPTLFTVAMASFAYLLPLRWLVRLPVALAFGLFTYFILLSQNVFSVAAIRTIPLYRAASTVSFLFTLITAFLLYSVLFSFNLLFYWNAILIFLLSLPLVLQIVWAVDMDVMTGHLLITSFIISLLIAELSIGLSFWPVATTIWSLFLATAMYVMLGIVTESLRGRLVKRIALEYLSIGVVIFIFTYFSTSWNG